MFLNNVCACICMEALNQAIQKLPIEIQEIIYKQYLKAKLNEKKDQGWKEIHDQIVHGPSCELREQILKVTVCRKCNECGLDRCCFRCFENGVNHFLDVYSEIFLKYI